MSNILDKCPVPILQEPWEFEQLVKIFKAYSPKKVLEIGSFYGGTLWFWLQARIKKDGLKQDGLYGDFKPAGEWLEVPVVHSLMSVDYPIGPSDGRYAEMLRCRTLWSEWTKHIEFHDLQGDSHSWEIIQKAHTIYPQNDVDFLFIDGDHSYNGVKADYENYAPLVRSGGLIVFHDVYGLPEVKQFWKELKQTERTQTIIGQPGGWGIGIVYKK
ncbi:class I SAM-dependent methyltransferase [Chitinophaga niabensis]|uniref:O-methyltransferase n=1 Tax=Chitinophaga niabensis TaxID=536979 RepID=UPI0031BB5754